MGFNPLKTRKEWQQIKKEHGIPDRVIKGGSFGEKMEKQQKKFESLGLRKVTNQNAQQALAWARDTDVLLDEWLTGARKLKPTAFTNQTKAIGAVTDMKTATRILKDVATAALNPIGMSKAKWADFDALWQTAKNNPTDPDKLKEMYSQGIRNYIGQGFHDAYKLRDTLGFQGGLTAALVRYEKLAAKWDHLQANHKKLADDDLRAEFWEDMTQARKLGKQIIQAGT